MDLGQEKRTVLEGLEVGLILTSKVLGFAAEGGTVVALVGEGAIWAPQEPGGRPRPQGNGSSHIHLNKERD